MNRSNAHLFKPFVDALIAGKTISYAGIPIEEFTFDGKPENYAIVEPVPLTYEDVEPGCHLRFPNGGDEIAITRLMPTGVKLENGISYTFEEFIHAEIYRPSTKTWSPAHK